MGSSNEELEARIEKLEQQLSAKPQPKTVRLQSKRKLLGLPLYDISIGPDLENGENRGYAKGILACGDVATGVFALGGIAQGGVAIGGLACGLLSLGGGAFGLLGAMGGVALGGFSFGGVAIGLDAIGGVEIEPGSINTNPAPTSPKSLP